VRFDDPAIGIAWPLPAAAVSERDRSFAFIDDRFDGIAS
jgi:dTDP-4-dehydrorhamnose 3,5-epimerase